jgi:hypothetical protein
MTLETIAPMSDNPVVSLIFTARANPDSGQWSEATP